MKRCKDCEEEKSIEEFPPCGGNKLSARCRPCKQKYDRDYWQRNKASKRDRKRENQKLRYNRNKLYVWKYLLNHPCCKCGECDPIVLEFDHIEPESKSGNISDIVGQVSISKLQDEIDKCQVLCANCHRRKTSSQFNHYEYLDVGKSS